MNEPYRGYEPTGYALLKRIKELEEKIEHIAKYLQLDIEEI